MDIYGLIRLARQEHCSDLHLTAGTRVAWRRYGQLRILDVKPTLEETVQMIYSLLTPQDIRLVEEGHDVDSATTDGDGGRIRINVYRQRNNLAASIRMLDSNIPTFEELGMPSVLENFSNKKSGLVLVTGPTGSGKSTTLASMINYINTTQDKHIMTIEDPIEYVYPHNRCMIHQRQVGKDVANFATALRSCLREDPDIIMVGEMRDYETISSAISAAETGHLVFSTLHTRGAAQTIERVIAACPIEAQAVMVSQFSSVLVGVITQELVELQDGNGRAAATEIMVNTNAIGNLIREGKTNQINTSLQAGKQLGMHTMNASLLSMYRMGMIDRDCAMRHSNAPAELEKMM